MLVRNLHFRRIAVQCLVKCQLQVLLTRGLKQHDMETKRWHTVFFGKQDVLIHNCGGQNEGVGQRYSVDKELGSRKKFTFGLEHILLIKFSINPKTLFLTLS